MSLLTYILGVPLIAALMLALVPRNFAVLMRAGAILGHVRLSGAGPGSVCLLPDRR